MSVYRTIPKVGANSVRSGGVFGWGTLGTANPAAKLNPAKVRLLRRLWEAQAFTPRELADLFQVSTHAISGVITGRTWWHVRSGGPLL